MAGHEVKKKRTVKQSKRKAGKDDAGQKRKGEHLNDHRNNNKQAEERE